VIRGGSWNYDDHDYVRASARLSFTPDNRYLDIGFRCARASSERQPPPSTPDCQLSGDDVPPGFLTINTSPPSVVYWNGKLLGETPIVAQRFPAGCVELVAQAANPTWQRTMRIRVEPDVHKHYRFEVH
jgi:hypothetical protein